MELLRRFERLHPRHAVRSLRSHFAVIVEKPAVAGFFFFKPSLREQMPETFADIPTGFLWTCIAAFALEIFAITSIVVRSA